jgi:membrane-associated protease RseP (regulator of RpoE activity)
VTEVSSNGSGRAAPDPDERLVLATQIVERVFPGAVAAPGPHLIFYLPSMDGLRERFPVIRRQLEPLALLPLLRRQRGQPALLLMPKPAPGQWHWRTNLLLLLATLITTSLSGYQVAVGLEERGVLQHPLRAGIAYAVALLFILGAHEMGHKLVAVRRRIDASLPYMIPMVPIPPLPGTLGAVIVTRTPAPDRDSLMDLGASGPIAGFLAAIPVLWYGVTHSTLIPIAPAGPSFYRFPDPLLMRWMFQIFLQPPPGYEVLGHPTLFAGWIGLLVTSINLLPAGMLDGGHAVRAALGPRAHRIASFLGLGLAVALGYFVMAALILLLMNRGHVGPLDDLSPMSPSRWVMAAVLVFIFVVSVVAQQPLF